jgi:hypothetical protein
MPAATQKPRPPRSSALRSSRWPLAAVAFLTVLGQLATARAETCPDVPDDEVALRRSMAKEWFAKAEEAEAGGDRQAAVRRYACSLHLAPHPSTAYNLGTVAEKSGDLSMAIDGFRTYLKLAPEATDRPAIEARIATLEQKIIDLRKQIAPKPPVEPIVETPPPVRQPVAPAIQPPAATATTTAGPRDDGSGRRIAAWVSLGGAAVTLATGVALNLEARQKMSDCYALYNARKMGALDRCDEAKPFAYGSYALFGAAGALAATGALLMFWPSDSSTAAAAEDAPEIGFVPTVGGGAVVASGRF